MAKKILNLLKTPLSEDVTLNRLLAARENILNDPTGEYVECLMEIMIEFLGQFPVDQSISLNNAEMNLEQAKFWFNQFFENEAEDE